MKEILEEFFFKFKKLIIYVYSNSFYLFFFVTKELRNLKIYKSFMNFDYILFSFIFYTVKSNIRKLFFKIYFFHSLLLLSSIGNPKSIKYRK